MKVELPTRIINDVYPINLDTEPSSGVRTTRVVPKIFGPTSDYVIDDPFIQGPGRYDRKDVYHAKLPDSYVPITVKDLTQSAIKAGVIYSNMQCLIGDDMQSPTREYVKRRYAQEDALAFWYGLSSCIVGQASGSGAINPSQAYLDYWGGTAWYTLYDNIEYHDTYVLYDRYECTVNLPFKYNQFKAECYQTTLGRLKANVPDRASMTYKGRKRTGLFNLEYTPSLPDMTSNLFSEDLLIEGLPGWRNQYELDWLIQHAFYDACQGIGKAGENNIQNVMQIIGDIAGICETCGIGGLELMDDVPKLSRRKRKISKYLRQYTNYDVVTDLDRTSSSWLKYRYSYCTSKMDYEQYIRYVNHKMDTYMAFLDEHHKETSHGTAQRVVDGCLVRMHCSIAYRPRTYEGLKSCCRYVHDMGLELNPYVLWDFVPYSFVVDWLAPVGDVLDVISNQKYYTKDYYDFGRVEFAVSYDFVEDGTGKGRRYYRWYQLPPRLESCYWFDKGGSKPSGKLVLKRTLDSAALVISNI